MKALKAGVILAGLVMTPPGMAEEVPLGAHDKARPCSVKAIAGRWIFATGIGQFPAYGGDITAIGTMNIDGRGGVSGTFDFTIALTGFKADASYEGTVRVEPDCTGTLVFQTSETTMRTDSIAIVGPGEFWGMSQDPSNLWTYRARRISTR